MGSWGAILKRMSHSISFPHLVLPISFYYPSRFTTHLVLLPISFYRIAAPFYHSVNSSLEKHHLLVKVYLVFFFVLSGYLKEKSQDSHDDSQKDGVFRAIWLHTSQMMGSGSLFLRFLRSFRDTERYPHLVLEACVDCRYR